MRVDNLRALAPMSTARASRGGEALRSSLRRAGPRIKAVASLSKHVLLIVGTLGPWDDSGPQSLIIDEAESVETRGACYGRLDDGGKVTRSFVMTARFPRPVRGMATEMVWRTDGQLRVVPVTDLRTVVRRELAGLAPEERGVVGTFLAATPSEHGGSYEPDLSANLRLIREAIRERLPSSLVESHRPLVVWIDAMEAVDERSFYVKGWFRDTAGTLTRITAVSPEGWRVELLDRCFRYERPDVDARFGKTPCIGHPVSGFIAYFEIGAPSLSVNGWIFEAGAEPGEGVEVVAPPVLRGDPGLAMILQDLRIDSQTSGELRLNHIHPAISRHGQLQASAPLIQVAEFGDPSTSPVVSIVVPLYRRIDLLEHQLAQFVDDTEVRGADLIYVLHRPELADTLAAYAAQLSALYRVSFRIVTLKENAGFAGGTNIAASLATAPRLLFMDSDVFPAAPGWLGRMTEFHESTPLIGALGPKLLSEDGSIRHAGMYFERHTASGMWERRYLFRGLDRDFPQAIMARPVPAVTGACLMIGTALYKDMGSLAQTYAQPGYEDSDLCVRLMNAGYENWYLPDATLYHLEGQSCPSETWAPPDQYNRWLFTRTWGERIASVMDGFPALSALQATRASSVEGHRM